MALTFVCLCGFATPDLHAFLDHQASGHGDDRFVGAGWSPPAEPAQNARSGRATVAEMRERERERVASGLADARARAREARRDPASVAAVEAAVAYHAANLHTPLPERKPSPERLRQIHEDARRRALERQAAREAGA